MILMDSSGWVEIAADGPRREAFVEAIHRAEEVAVPTIVVREVCRAVEAQAGQAEAELLTRYLSTLHVVPLDFDLAVDAARVGKQLGLALADSIIYASALAVGATIITGDADFADLDCVTYIPLADPEAQ